MTIIVQQASQPAMKLAAELSTLRADLIKILLGFYKKEIQQFDLTVALTDEQKEAKKKQKEEKFAPWYKKLKKDDQRMISGIFAEFNKLLAPGSALRQLILDHLDVLQSHPSSNVQKLIELTEKILLWHGDVQDYSIELNELEKSILEEKIHNCDELMALINLFMIAQDIHMALNNPPILWSDVELITNLLKTAIFSRMPFFAPLLKSTNICAVKLEKDGELKLYLTNDVSSHFDTKYTADVKVSLKLEDNIYKVIMVDILKTSRAELDNWSEPFLKSVWELHSTIVKEHFPGKKELFAEWDKEVAEQKQKQQGQPETKVEDFMTSPSPALLSFNFAEGTMTASKEKADSNLHELLGIRDSKHVSSSSMASHASSASHVSYGSESFFDMSFSPAVSAPRSTVTLPRPPTSLSFPRETAFARLAREHAAKQAESHKKTTSFMEEILREEPIKPVMAKEDPTGVDFFLNNIGDSTNAMVANLGGANKASAAVVSAEPSAALSPDDVTSPSPDVFSPGDSVNSSLTAPGLRVDHDRSLSFGKR